MAPARHIAFFMLLLGSMLTSVESTAQTGPSKKWVGASVMPKQDAKYLMGDKELDQPLPLPLEVYAIDGDWLVVGGGKIRATDARRAAEASAYYEKLLKDNPRNSWALCQRGILVGTEGELEKAERDFNAAIQANSKNAEAFVMRGVLHATNEEFDKAIEDFTKAISIRPDYADAYHQRGTCYSDDLLDDEKAIADFTQAIKVCPQFCEAYAGRGLAYQLSGHAKEAVADYDKAITLNPYHADCLSNRAIIRAACPDASLRNGKLALEDAKRANDLTKGKDAEILNVLAAAHAEAGQFDEAVKIQTQAAMRAKGKERLESLERVGLYSKKQPYRYELPPSNP